MGYEYKDHILKPGTSSEIPIGMFLDNKLDHVSAIIFSCTLTLGKLTSISISQKKSHVQLNSVMCIRHDVDFPHYKPQIISPESPEYLSDGVFIFHNLFAKSPLPKNTFNQTNAIEVFFDTNEKKVSMSGNNLPIVSRLNLFNGKHFMKSSLREIIEKFNPELVTCLAKVISIDEAEDLVGYDVGFQDLEDISLCFTLPFTEGKLEEYNVGHGKLYEIAFRLVDNNTPPITEESFTIYQKFKKIRCIEFSQGELVSIHHVEKI